ncbi:MAG: TonB family protein [Acidobacteriia bacterium]|nr:TonB family protein [Terriglobia bacterium]
MADTYSSFGKFLLLKQRAQDGLGTVWRAGEMERNSFRRIVWLRRFDQVGLDRTALNEEIGAANQIAQILKATNVVRNATYGSEGGVSYIAWDYVPAQPLDQVMARATQEQFPIAIDNALLIVEKLAASLAAASAVEVKGEPLIHGFLVPHLALVGNDGEAQVAGFGMAHGLRANLDRAAVKRLAAPYMAPEVLAKGPATARSDVYSLGAILLQLLSGQALPADPAMRAAVLDAPTLAFEEGPIPQDVLAIIRKTLAQRPDDRYASAAEFKKELEKLLYGGAYSPTTFNLALFMDRLYRNEIELEDRELQHERALDVGAYYQPPKPETPEPPVATPTSSRAGLYAAIAGGAVLLLVIGYLLLNRQSTAPPVDQEAQKKMLQELVNTQVAQALKEKEDQLRKELDAEKARTEELRKQLDKQKQGAPGARQVSTDEQQRLQRELAARETEQKQKEAELLRVKQQQEAEAAKARQQQAQVTSRLALQATPPPAVPAPAFATSSGPQTAPTQVPVAPAAVPAGQTPTAPPAQGPATTGLGAGVKLGDLVDFSQVDRQPQVLMEGNISLQRVPGTLRSPVEGTVILSALVNEKGGVDDVKILRSFPDSTLGVDEACVQAVRKYRFRPAMKDGVKVKTWYTVTVPVVVRPTR